MMPKWIFHIQISIGLAWNKARESTHQNTLLQLNLITSHRVDLYITLFSFLFICNINFRWMATCNKRRILFFSIHGMIATRTGPAGQIFVLLYQNGPLLSKQLYSTYYVFEFEFSTPFWQYRTNTYLIRWWRTGKNTLLITIHKIIIFVSRAMYTILQSLTVHYFIVVNYRVQRIYFRWTSSSQFSVLYSVVLRRWAQNNFV